MLSREDCIALSGLTEDEIRAIAQHERIPEITAAELGHSLLATPEGEREIKSMIRDDILGAAACGDVKRELALKFLLWNFVCHHPSCEERRRRAERRAAERRQPFPAETP